jgi:hypothetical protein
MQCLKNDVQKLCSSCDILDHVTFYDMKDFSIHEDTVLPLKCQKKVGNMCQDPKHEEGQFTKVTRVDK